MIDPKKMASWAQGGGGEGPKPGPEDANEGAEGDEPENEHEQEEEQEDEGGDKGELLACLEEFSEEVSQCCDELDGDALTDPEVELEGEDLQILQDGLNALPPKLKKCLQKSASDMSFEEAQSIADHLGEEDKIEDPDRLAGWLYRVGQVV